MDLEVGAIVGDKSIDDTPVWRSHRWQFWTEALLDHFFSNKRPSTDASAPVTFLNLANQSFDWGSLAPEFDGDELLDRYVDLIVGAAARNKSFWHHARDWQRSYSKFPYYFGHLLVGCIAIADGDAADEQSNIACIARRTGAARGDQYLEVLPELWESLAKWLEQNSDSHRPLHLPDPGGWSRIGVTVHLTFPVRADLRRISECFFEKQVAPLSSPFATVVDALRSVAPRCSQRFQSELRRFAQLLPKSDFDSMAATPFWSAIVSSTQIADLQPSAADQWTLLLDDDDYSCSVSLSTTADSAPKQRFVELEDMGHWKYEFEGDLPEALELVMSGEMGTTYLRQRVRSGVLPFAELSPGVMELASGSSLALCDTYLVRGELQAPLLAATGGRLKATGYPNWNIVRGARLDLDLMPPQLLEALGFSDSRSVERAISLVDGLRIDKRWLGQSPFLPRIVAKGTLTAIEIATGRALPVAPAEMDGEFLFAVNSIHGEVELISDEFGVRRTKRIEFAAAPDTEQFRELASPQAWVVENVLGSRRYSRPSHSDEVHALATEERVFLGEDVGCFVGDHQDAFWEITFVGDKSRVRPGARYRAGHIPKKAVASKRDRRQWRRLLAESDSSLLGDGERSARTQAIRATGGVMELVAQRHSPELAIASVKQLPEVPAITDALTGLFNRRQRLGRPALVEILQDGLSLDYAGAQSVIRSWIEAGLLDELVCTRWSNRSLRGVQPHFRMMKSGDEYQCALTGLCLQSKISAIRNAAPSFAIQECDVQPVSVYSPHGLLLRTTERQRLDDLSLRLGIPIKNLSPFDMERKEDREFEIGAPQNFTRRASEEIDGELLLEYWSAKGNPSYWSVVQADRTIYWTHFRELARYWAKWASGKSPITALSSKTFTTGDVFLPLPIARWLQGIGGRPSGLADAGYVYSCASKSIQDTFIKRLEQDSKAIASTLLEGK